MTENGSLWIFKSHTDATLGSEDSGLTPPLMCIHSNISNKQFLEQNLTVISEVSAVTELRSAPVPCGPLQLVKEAARGGDLWHMSSPMFLYSLLACGRRFVSPSGMKR